MGKRGMRLGGVRQYVTSGPRLTTEQAAFLALLLLADGAAVPFQAVASLSIRGTCSGRATAQHHLKELLRAGVQCVEVLNHGCRMTGMLPDWTLDDVLAQVTILRSSCGSPTSRRLLIA